MTPPEEIFIEDGDVYLIRCTKCGRENYAVNVASGICTWCGYNAKKKIDYKQNNKP